MKNPSLRKALAAHHWLLIIIGLSWLVTSLQCIYLGVPWADFIDDIGPKLGLAFLKFVVTMLALAMITFARQGFSWWPFEKRANGYLSSETFSFSLIGTIVIVSASLVFIMQKCLIPFFNPFGHWDPLFAEWDRVLHFGRYPHEYLVPIAVKWPFFAELLDYSYYAWYAVVSLTCIYCLYCDKDFRRRMHYLWAYVIAFLFAGAGTALVFSSVGPLFYADFMPDIPNPYEGLMGHLSQMNDQVGLNFFVQKHWLLDWVHNNQFMDTNSISAMPSMHNATMLFSALYLRTVNRHVFRTTCVLTVLVFLGSIYTGFHYAIDAYAGYGIIIALWWLTGRLVERLYPQTENAILTR